MPTQSDNSLLFQDLTGTLGTINYGGFQFPALNDTKIDIEPLQDKTGKVRVGTKIKVQVKFLLLPGMLTIDTVLDDLTGNDIGTIGSYNTANTTDNGMDTLRLYLESPGNYLQITGKGFGNLVIYPSKELAKAGGNEFANYRDVDIEGGPLPKIIGWVPMTNKISMVTWECEAVISGCNNLSSDVYIDDLGIRSFTTSLSTSIDKNGLTIRDISGEIQIITTAGERTLEEHDQAIKIIDKVYPHLKVFNRSYPNITIAEDRRSVSFTIHEEEIGSDTPYFPGLSTMSAKLRAASSIEVGFSRWSCSLDFRCEVQKGEDKQTGFIAFALILKHLYNKKELAKYVRNNTTAESTTTPNEEKGWAILTEISMEDELFGREVSCSANWDLYCNMRHVLKASGLFRPVDSDGKDQYLGFASTSAWKDKAEEVQNAGGFQNYIFTTNYYSEYSPSVCNDPSQKTSKTGYEKEYSPPAQNTKKEPSYTPDLVDDMAEYDNRVALHTDEKTYAINSLEDLNATKEYNANLDVNLRDQQVAPSLNGVSPASPNSAQAGAVNVPRNYYSKTSKTQYYATMVGRAVRLGRPCPVPSLFSVGGKEAVKVGKDYTRVNPIGQGMDDNGKVYVIYETVWAKKYLLSDAPTNATIVSDGAQAIMPS